MIYPKAIFRTVIALSTVAAATQATVASPGSSTKGAKRGKGGRYIDTTTNAYGTTSIDALNMVSPTTYVNAAAKAQVGVNLRKITSPNGAGGKFSVVSPTNIVQGNKGKSGYVSVIGTPSTHLGNTYRFPESSPRSLDHKGGKKNGHVGNYDVPTPPVVVKGKESNYGAPGAPVQLPANTGKGVKGSKDGKYGVDVPVAPSSGGYKSGNGNKGKKSGKTDNGGNYGGDVPLTGGYTDGKGGKSSKSNKGGNYGVDIPSTGGYTDGKGGKLNKGGKGAADIPSTGGKAGKPNKGGKGERDGNYSPVSPSTGGNYKGSKERLRDSSTSSSYY
ncbi:unnamed protein product [Phytophthora lilii]|uniref:Unnamed protein product n=1 Tax=Phytophthora lilii TaxID=2077276 RepID=A0A9W7CLV2_9STRA|nr:unnamed protein product [Phytophthora lilii]